MDFHYVTEHPSDKKIPHVFVLSRHIAVVMTSLLVWTGCVIGTEIGSILPSAQTGWILQLEQTFRCPIRFSLQTSEMPRSASSSSDELVKHLVMFHRDRTYVVLS